MQQLGPVEMENLHRLFYKAKQFPTQSFFKSKTFLVDLIEHRYERQYIMYDM